jgi:hypothetical protein
MTEEDQMGWNQICNTFRNRRHPSRDDMVYLSFDPKDIRRHPRHRPLSNNVESVLVYYQSTLTRPNSLSRSTTWFSTRSRHRNSISRCNTPNAASTYSWNPTIPDLPWPIKSIQHPRPRPYTTNTEELWHGRTNHTTTHQFLELTNDRRQTTRIAWPAFSVGAWTTQGDIVSPTIFNIIVDAVVRAGYNTLNLEGLADDVQAIFYADDGHL